MALIGRQREREAIAGMLDDARHECAGALAIVGEPGIGKTALLDDAAAQAEGEFTVLRVRGVETETETAFAGLAVVLMPLLGELGDLPPPQAEALRGALALADVPVGPLAVCSATLAMIAQAAERRPVLVLVDDAHWLDEPSVEALLFMARRLAADRVVTLFAVRPRESAAVTQGGIRQLALDGLDAEAARTLLADADMTPAVVARVTALTGGNPLALLETPALLDTDQRRGNTPIATPLPLGDVLRLALLRQVTALPQRTRWALVIAAAQPLGDTGPIATALARHGRGLADLGPAEAAKLVVIDGGTVGFSHPLVRSAVYHGASPEDRRAAHRLLADSLPAGRSPDERAWHLTAAAEGPDEEVAALLERTAAQAEQRGALSTAAMTFERAASLSPEDEARSGRLLAAGRALWRAGRIDDAVPLLDRAVSLTHDAGVRADASILRGQAETWRIGPGHGHAWLVAAADAVESSDPDRATALLTHAVSALLLTGDARRAVPLAHRARALADRGSGRAVLAAAAAQAQALLVHGDSVEAARLMAPLRQVAEGLAGSTVPEADHLVQVVAVDDLFREDWESGQLLTEGVIARARTSGALGTLWFSSAVLADLSWRTGRWQRAYEVALLDRELGERAANLVAGRSYAQAVLARIEAGLGLEVACRRDATAALELGARTGMGAVRMWAGSALGLLELGLGNLPAALDQLETVRRCADEGEVREPGAVWWMGDLIEARWRAGDLDGAAGQVDVLAAQAEATGRTWARAVAARGRGLVAGEATFDDYFAEALDWHAQLDAPFERARTLLCRGERRVRAGRFENGAADLRAALDGFEQLGAAPWSARALLLLGGRPSSAPVSVLRRLTASEVRVALAVARGLSSKAAAQELYLSVKTIDFHLGNIYRKLGLRSRSEMAALVARQGTAGGMGTGNWESSQ
jgi:DNA-binding CsgD family transcriptional regulator